MVPKSETSDRLHSVESAAEFLGGLSQSTIRSWLTRGLLTRVKVGSRTMIRESELLQMIHEDLRKSK
jgi:excisionase family DNA binding protein